MGIFKDSGKLIAGLIVGAGAMFLLDPDRGNRRRALVRDQGMRAKRRFGDGLTATARDLRNRSRGAAAELSSRFRRESADDEVIHERVRAELGRVVSHPGSITVAVDDGRVMLTGPIESREAEGLVAAVSKVRGVREVEDRLELFEDTESVPGLQGGGQPG